MVEYIEYEYNFPSFKEFLEEHEGVLFQEDYMQYVTLGLQYQNKKVLHYIIEKGLLKDWTYNIALFNESYGKECLEKLLKKNFDINSKNNGHSLLDYAVTNYITKTDNEKDQFLYIIYIIENGGKLDIEKFCNHINNGLLTDDNMLKIVQVIDLMLLFNLINNTLELNTEELKLLFQNIDKSSKDLLTIIDKNLLNLLKEYYNTDDTEIIYLNINKLCIINKSSWIDDDLFVYYDGTENWCFSKEDVKYIKNTKMNPLNDLKLPDYIIDLI